MSEEYWVIAVKNSAKQDKAAALAELQRALNPHAKSFSFEVPELRVGTLEKLMLAGDQLGKIDGNLEALLRKIENSFEEFSRQSGVNEVDAHLSVGNAPPSQFVEQFRWNAARYSTSRSIEDLVKTISQNMNKIETELKDSIAIFNERKGKVQALIRQRDSNFVGANLDEVLTPKVGDKGREYFRPSEYLQTVPVVVTKINIPAFESGYEAFGDNLVGYGKEGNRESIKGSPVVPKSLVFIDKDKEGNHLYLVTVLKKFVEEWSAVVTRAKCVVREYDFEASFERWRKLQLEGTGKDAVDQAQDELDDSRKQFVSWCRANYGDAFSAWVHLKAIRIFVESVLRYGLPVNFSAALVHPAKAAEKNVRGILDKLFKSQASSDMLEDEDDAKDTLQEKLFAYVSFTICPHGKKI